MDLTQRTGRRLRDLRLQRQHTLAAVAGDLRVSPSALSAYELGRRPITLALLERFTRYYGHRPHERLKHPPGGSHDQRRRAPGPPGPSTRVAESATRSMSPRDGTGPGPSRRERRA